MRLLRADEPRVTTYCRDDAVALVKIGPGDDDVRAMCAAHAKAADFLGRSHLTDAMLAEPFDVRDAVTSILYPAFEVAPRGARCEVMS